MPRPQPDHRGRAVLAAAQAFDAYPGQHPYEIAFFRLLKEMKDVTPEIHEAYDLYVVEEHQHVLNASIFAKATNEQIADALEMSVGTVSVYRHLFCDRNVFPNALVIPNYIKSLSIHDDYKAWYALAYRQGPDSLLRRFRLGTPAPISPDEVMQGVVADQYDRFLTHRGEQINSEIAMAALSWGKEAAKTASMILQRGESSPPHGESAMKLALRVSDKTQTVEQAGLTLEDLVTE